MKLLKGFLSGDPTACAGADGNQPPQAPPRSHRAGERADALLEGGDMIGAATWRGIVAAIEELRRGGREDPAQSIPSRSRSRPRSWPG